MGAAIDLRDEVGIAMWPLPRWPWILPAALLALLPFAGGRIGRLRNPVAPAVVLALAFAPLLLLLCNRFVNPDGGMFASKFERDVPLAGAHLTHDELLELYVHSRAWAHAHAWWGWSVERTYEVVSAMAGVVFLAVLPMLARRVAPRSPALFLAGVIAGGYMQLFFGDVENYTITAALVTIYLLTAAAYLAGELPLAAPTVALAVAICFHLLAGWLVPSLAYLYLISWRRDGDAAVLMRNAGSFVLIGAGVLVYFHFNGLPIRRLFSSHLGEAVRFKGMLVGPGLPRRYALDQINLLQLLCPAVLMLVPLAAWRRLAADEVGRFLIVAAGFMLLFQAVWKSQIGVYNDWNLYASGALVVAVLIWRSIATAADSRGRRAAAFGLAIAGGAHTYSWIVSNHFFGR